MGGSDGSNAAACENRANPVATKHIHQPGTPGAGTDNAGQNCMQANCHGPGGPTQFQFAGTIYKTDGVTPNPGVTIKFTTTGGMSINPPIQSDDGGNFYCYAGTIANAFPALTTASVCPATDQPMTEQLAADTGPACNSCHVAGGAAGGVITIADQ